MRRPESIRNRSSSSRDQCSSPAMTRILAKNMRLESDVNSKDRRRRKSSGLGSRLSFLSLLAMRTRTFHMCALMCAPVAITWHTQGIELVPQILQNASKLTSNRPQQNIFVCGVPAHKLIRQPPRSCRRVSPTLSPLSTYKG
jgi:hypothetical protein